MKTLAHAHTTYSRDGTLSPRQLAGLASRRGFQAVLVSDHFEHLDGESFARLVADCAAQSACLLVPGYERSWSGFHICAFGLERWLDADRLEDWSAAVRAAGGLTCLAHPARYGFEVPPEILAACDAIEVWNSKRPYDGGLAPDPRAWRLVGERRLPIAGQDLHRRSDLTSVGLETGPVTTGRGLVSEIRAGRSTIVSRWLRLDGRPPRRLDPLLGVWQRFRPRLWAPPLATYRLLRRLARRWRRD